MVQAWNPGYLHVWDKKIVGPKPSWDSEWVRFKNSCGNLVRPCLIQMKTHRMARVQPSLRNMKQFGGSELIDVCEELTKRISVLGNTVERVRGWREMGYIYLLKLPWPSTTNCGLSRSINCTLIVPKDPSMIKESARLVPSRGCEEPSCHEPSQALLD